MSFDLSDIQRWMLATIAGNQSMQDASIAAIDDVILPSSKMTSDQRLAIYQHAYLARLIECLRAEFPMLCAALGQELFDEFAAGYLVQHPSTSYTLTELGRAFPGYLADTYPSDDMSTAWYEAIVELASLEWVTAEVFQGPGTEQLPPLDVSQLTPEAWESISLSLSPCVRLLEFRYPVHDYYRALRANSNVVPPSESRTLIVVSRLDYTVRHNAVSESLFMLLCSLEEQSSLLDAIVAAAEVSDVDADTFAAQLHQWFIWLAAERLVALS